MAKRKGGKKGKGQGTKENRGEGIPQGKKEVLHKELQEFHIWSVQSEGRKELPS